MQKESSLNQAVEVVKPITTILDGLKRICSDDAGVVDMVNLAIDHTILATSQLATAISRVETLREDLDRLVIESQMAKSDMEYWRDKAAATCPGPFKVLFTSSLTKKVQVIKAVREHTGMSLRDAKELVEFAVDGAWTRAPDEYRLSKQKLKELENAINNIEGAYFAEVRPAKVSGED